MSGKKQDLKAAMEEQLRSFQRARREGFNLAQWRQLRALKAYLDEIGEAECKTVGNGNPPGLHCFACTWNHLRKELERAEQFWSNECYRNGALS